MDNIYALLDSLPLMRGASKTRLLDIIGKAKLHFLKFLPGEVISEAGTPCTHVRFIISGSVKSSICNPEMKFRVTQTLAAPAMLFPDYLFGKSPFVPAQVVADTTCGVLQIEKKDYLRLLDSDPAFLFNFLNVLSTSGQRSVEGLLALTTGNLEERIAYWIVSLTQPEGTDIVMSCRAKDLYSIFGVSRSSLIATLDSMKDRGIITYTTHEINVVSRAALVQLLSGDSHKE